MNLLETDLTPGTGLDFICFADLYRNLSQLIPSFHTAGLNQGAHTHAPRPYTARPSAQNTDAQPLLRPLSPPAGFLRARHTVGRTFPASLARGQTGPVQSPSGPGHARTSLRSRTPGPALRLGSVEALVKAVPGSAEPPGPSEGAHQGSCPSPCARGVRAPRCGWAPR